MIPETKDAAAADINPAGTEFSQYLKERGATAKDLAKGADVTSSYAYMIIRGAAVPSRKVARRIEAWTAAQFGAEKAFGAARW